MTVFRQENVDDYYDTGEELGRYWGCRKRTLLGCANACYCKQWAVNKCSLKSGVSLALPGDAQIIEKRVTNPVTTRDQK